MKTRWIVRAVALCSHGRLGGRPLRLSTPPEQTRRQDVAVQAKARAMAKHSAARQIPPHIFYPDKWLGFGGRTALILIMAACTLNVCAQRCDYTLSGRVVDEHDQSALSYPEIWLPELNRGAVGDSSGHFRISGLCAGQLRVVCHHLGCVSLDTVLTVHGNHHVVFFMEHHAELLEMVEVSENRYRRSGASRELTGKALHDRRHLPVAEAIAQLPGVALWQGVGAISKPVIDGLMGVRLVMAVNGTRQEDQQWGNDHAPAFDLLSAGRVSVVRGASALLYGPESVGGAIDVETRALPDTPLVRQQYCMMRMHSNGRGAQAVYETSKRRQSGAGWVWAGGMHRHGDFRAPGYLLTNTGSFSGSASGMFRSALRRGWRYESDARIFLNDMAILRAAHVGNLTDLKAAIGAPSPLFEAPLSYLIDAPRQSVQHLSETVHAIYQPKLELRHNFHASLQWNRRREFDRRRGGRSDIPVLHLQLLTPAAGWRMSRISDRGVGEWAIQWQGQFNYNIFGTGFLPLLPDYNQHTLGVARLQRRVWRWSGLELEYGARADFRRLTRIEPTGVSFVRTTRSYLMWAGHIGAVKHWSRHQLHLSVNQNRRAPAVNELFSNGIHQSVAAYESGNPALRPELSTKAILDHQFEYGGWVIHQSAFVQFVAGFINPEPLPEPILTIRGAFPAFIYKQHDVLLAGHSAAIQYDFSRSAKMSAGYNFYYHRVVRGIEPYLYYQPSSRFFVRFDQSYQRWHFSTTVIYQTRQHLAPPGDLLSPPVGYWLAHADLSYTWRNQRVLLSCHNVFDKSYRDYLSRMRYFADQPGRDIRLILQLNL